MSDKNTTQLATAHLSHPSGRWCTTRGRRSRLAGVLNTSSQKITNRTGLTAAESLRPLGGDIRWRYTGVDCTRSDALLFTALFELKLVSTTGVPEETEE